MIKIAHTKICIIDDDEDLRMLYLSVLDILNHDAAGYDDYRPALEDIHDGWIPDIFVIDQHYKSHYHVGTDIIDAFKEVRGLRDKPYILKSCEYIPTAERGQADYYCTGSVEDLVIKVKKAELGLK